MHVMQAANGQNDEEQQQQNGTKRGSALNHSLGSVDAEMGNTETVQCVTTLTPAVVKCATKTVRNSAVSSQCTAP